MTAEEVKYRIRHLVNTWVFQIGVLVLICLAAIMVGVETYPVFTSRYGESIHFINNLILWAFVVEAAMKMAQHGKHFLRYFKDPWNVFDFSIIAICFLPINASYAAVLRLARVFRSLRLVTALPRLQLLVNALLKSIPSMFYVGVLLFLVFYVYAVMGVFLFRDNDPVHFCDLQTSLLSLFRVVTQEDWTDVMYIQMYGSDVYPPPFNTSNLEYQPSARPVLGALFFVTFVFLGTMIMLNLFIGVILNSMDEAQKERTQELFEAEDKVRTPSLDHDVSEIQRQCDKLQQQLVALRTRLDLTTEQNPN